LRLFAALSVALTAAFFPALLAASAQASCVTTAQSITTAQTSPTVLNIESVTVADNGTSSTSTPVIVQNTCGGDDVSYQVALPTTITFAGTEYNAVYATTNSTIVFGRQDNNYSNFPATTSISVNAYDWVVLSTANTPGYPAGWQSTDEHLIITSSQAGFQVDLAVRPYGSNVANTPLSTIVVTAAINADNTLTITYLSDIQSNIATRTGVRLPDGSIVTLEQAGLTRVYVAPVVTAEVITPGPSESPTATATPTPSPTPTTQPAPSPTPSETPTQTAEPSPTPSPSILPSQSPTPSPTPTPEVTPSPEPSPAPSPVPEPSPTPLPEPAPRPEPPFVSPAVEPEPSPMPPEQPAVEPEPSPEPSPDPQAIPDPEGSIGTPDVPTEPPVGPAPETDPELVPEPAPEPPVAPEPSPEPVVAPETPLDPPSVAEEVTAVVDDLLADGKLSAADGDNILEALNADGEVSKEEVNSLSDALAADGKLTNAEKELVAEALIQSVAPGETLTKEQIQDAGIAYQDLPPETPVEVRQDENGNEVIITADVAAALVLLENPSELIGAIFSDPGQALQALGSIGADMSDEERKESTEAVVATVIAAGAAINAVGAATGGASSRTGGSSGGGNSGGGGASGDSKGVRRRKP